MCDNACEETVQRGYDVEPRNATIGTALAAKQPEGEILGEISTQEKMLEEVYMLVHRLADKISPVSNIDPRDTAGEATADKYYATQVGNLLHNNNDKILRTIYTLQDVIERVKI